MAEPNFAARNQTDVLARERKDILTIPWIIATCVIGVYAGVVAHVGRSVGEALAPSITALLILIGAACAVASVVVPRLLLGDKQLRAQLREPIDTYRWLRAMRLRGKNSAAFLALPPDEQRLLSLTMVFQRPYLLGLALTNGVALTGLVYGLLIKTPVEAAPFLLTAIGLMGWHYPRLGPLIDRGRKLDLGEEEDQAIALLDKLNAADAAAEKAAQRVSPPAQPAQPRPQPPLRRPSRAQGPTKP